jgi:3-deoxy-D-arabino-heptulosonate 7-phosphate (DAHP) synthase class II
MSLSTARAAGAGESPFVAAAPFGAAAALGRIRAPFAESDPLVVGLVRFGATGPVVTLGVLVAEYAAPNSSDSS